MQPISVLGVDLAKRVFQIHGVDSTGKAVIQKALSRGKFEEFVIQLPPCVIGMEAGGSAHYWARRLSTLGHTVRLIAPQFVKPFVKANKTDAADAEAITEAIQRPSMRFVRPKDKWQCELQSLHRIRSSLVRERTAVLNSLYALLYEQGVVVTKQAKKLREEALLICDSSSGHFRLAVRTLLQRLDQLDGLTDPIELELRRFAKAHPDCKRLQSIPGVGVLSSTAIIATVGDPAEFKNGRQFSASIGLVPKQASSGGKQNLLGISKRGDPYLRTLLIHGARSVLRTALKHPDDRIAQWSLRKASTRGQARTIVAIANKNARIIWALLKTKEDYKNRIAA